MKNTIMLALAAVITCFFTSAIAESEAAKQTLTFGVVPQQSAGKLARNWGPILKHIEAETGIKLRFATAPSIPEFERRLAKGEYDLSYMNPYHYTVFHEAPGYQAFAKAKGKQIKGIVVVHKDSEIQDLRELDGSVMAFPAPAAFAASVLPRAYLANEEINVEPKYVSSHDSVYISVARGLYPAGGGIIRTLNSIDPGIRNELRVLWTTNPFTSHALASHPRVSPEAVGAIQAAMVDLENSEAGLEMLGALSWKGVEAAENSRWNDVRELGLDLLDMLINGT
jgi:phosphonate transport system substrate-binding protein